MALEPQVKQHATGIIRRLNRTYPEVECALAYQTPLQLLVATILSAQCTDERVNMVTRDLFKKHPTASDLAALSQAEMERLIKSTGFFRNKAKNIRACCETLVRHHGGDVPRDLDQLVQLPGVGRKTANVVLGTAFGMATGVVVDTHVSRLSQRLGMTVRQDPVRIEQDLMAQVPRKEWIGFSHRLIHHGRQVCKARRPLCDQCSLADVCPKRGV